MAPAPAPVVVPRQRALVKRLVLAAVRQPAVLRRVALRAVPAPQVVLLPQVVARRVAPVLGAVAPQVALVLRAARAVVRVRPEAAVRVRPAVARASQVLAVRVRPAVARVSQALVVPARRAAVPREAQAPLVLLARVRRVPRQRRRVVLVRPGPARQGQPALAGRRAPARRRQRQRAAKVRVVRSPVMAMMAPRQRAERLRRQQPARPRRQQPERPRQQRSQHRCR